MSKSKKPRKAYRPTHAPNPRAFMVAIRGAHLLCAHDQLTRAARVRSSVEMPERPKHEPLPHEPTPMHGRLVREARALRELSPRLAPDSWSPG